jgi:tripartite-type tricarboxylate transporter receptor subunit TctC
MGHPQLSPGRRRGRRTVALALGALGAVVSAPSPAQSWPLKPVRIVVGFAPGGGTDFVARVIGHRLSEVWGQQVLVENRAGAAGTIGADSVARSTPDGHTLLMGHVNSHAIAPSVYRRLPYDALRDFQMVTYVGYVPNVLTLHPSLPAKSVKELIALVRSRPGQVTFASSGTGSTQHLAGEMFMSLTGTKMVHVPYKGSGQAIQDLVGGHVLLNFDTMPPVLDHIRSGKLRALAVTTPRRAAQLPDVPTLEELGLRGFDMTNWYGVMAPAGTPRAIVNGLSTEINRMLREPGIREKLQSVGTDIGGGTPEEFEAFLRSEIEKYAKLVKAAGVQIDN